jgi:chromosome segregation ATPase
MGIRIIADDVADLPEALRASAKEADGTWHAELPTGWAIEDVAGLRNALQDEKATRRTLSSRVEEAESERESLKAKLAALSSEGEGKLEEYRAQLEAKVAADIEAREAKIKALADQNWQLSFGQQAMQAIAEHKGNAKLLMPLVERRVRRELDEQGNVRMVILTEDGKEAISRKSGSVSPMDLGELLSEMKSDSAYQAAFEGSAGGSGANHATGGSGRGQVDVSKLTARDLWSRANAK